MATDSDKARHPLKISEIVANVMQHVIKDGHPDVHTLFSYLLVNWLWFEEATTCLWSYKPPIKAVTTPGHLFRCQYYAAKVVAITYQANECKDYELLTSLNFPRLQQLEIACDNTGDEYRLLLHILRPSLRSLSLRGCISDEVLWHIRVRSPEPSADITPSDYFKENCPLVTSLFLAIRGIQITPSFLLLLLLSAPSITDLTLRFDNDNDAVGSKRFELPVELFKHLAGRQNMQNLCIDSSTLTVSVAHAILRHTRQPFHQLPVFKCLAKNEAFALLVRHLPELKELHVDLLGESPAAISAIACCTNLTTLAITLHDTEYYFYHNALLTATEQCKQLQSFSFCIRHTYPGRINPVEYVVDKHVEELSANMPNLTTFIFDLYEPTRLSALSLRHLANNCPRLEVGRLPNGSYITQS